MKNLSEYRRDLDMLDAQLCYLIEKRIALLDEIDKCREAQGMPTDEEDRARQMMSRVRMLTVRHGAAVGRAYGEILKIGRGRDAAPEGCVDLNSSDDQ